MSKKKIKKQQEAYFYGYAIYRDSNGIVHVDCITDTKECVELYFRDKNIILEIAKGICFRDNLQLLAIVRMMDIMGFKTLDTDIMPGVVPNEFINELNAKMEKNFGYKSGDINYIPIGL